MSIFQEIRKTEYAYIGNTVYLSNASVGLPPMSVLDKTESFEREYIYGLYEIDMSEVRYRVREKIAYMLGTTNEQCIVFTKGTGEGIALLANALQWEHDDNIVLVSCEYPGTSFPWFSIGIDVRVINCVNGVIDIDDFISVADSHTKAFVVSMVQYSSGFRIDLKKLGDYCATHGIYLFVDGIQGIGRLSLSVTENHISALSCGGYKGLLGNFGIGFLYLEPQLLKKMKPKALDDLCFTNTVYPNEYYGLSDMTLHSDYRRLEAGNHNNHGIIQLSHSLDFLHGIGIERIEKHVLELGERLIKEIEFADLPLRLIGSRRKEHCSGIVTYSFPPEKREGIKSVFEMYQIKADLFDNTLRISFNLYNLDDDIDKTVSSLKISLR